MSIKKTGLTIVVFLLLLQIQAQDSLNKNFGIGLQVGQHQNDFGIGLNVSSPYFSNQKMTVRLKANLVWNEHPDNNSEATWTPYSNLSIGFVQSVGEINNFVRVYGEGGAILLFPSSEFSSESTNFGGYGLFGFEFYFDEHYNYFFEAGGVGTGAREDKITGNPIYSNGFLVNVGFRAQF